MNVKVISASVLSLAASLAAADVNFIELPIDGRVGSGPGWIDVSNNGKVVFAQYQDASQQFGLGPIQGMTWSQSEGTKVLANPMGFSVVNGPQFVSISGDGITTVYGNQVFKGAELVLTTNSGIDKSLNSLSRDGDFVGIFSQLDGGAALQSIASGNITPVNQDLPSSTYRVQDFANDSGTMLLGSSNANFLNIEPFYIRNNDELYEIPVQYGVIDDLSGDGTTVIGRSLICESHPNCVIISNASTNIELGGGAYFPGGINNNGSIAVLSERDYENNDWSGYIWDQANGLRNIVNLLSNQGIDISDWSQVKLNNISDNGYFIVGEGLKPNGTRKNFLIDATPECSPNGLL